MDDAESRCLRRSCGLTPKKRKSVRQPSATRSRSTPAPSPQLVEIRGAFQVAIGQLKALGCEDSMILVEFWHALDCVNGEDFSDV
jgi:hypothetical protein